MKDQLKELFAITIGTTPTLAAFDLRRFASPISSQICQGASDYLSSVPENTLSVGYYNLLAHEDILNFSENHIPGYHCIPYGFVVIARDLSGDVASLDLTTGEVYLMSHDKFEEDGLHPGWNADLTEFLPVLPYSRKVILDHTEGYWTDVSSFLSDLISAYKNSNQGA